MVDTARLKTRVWFQKFALDVVFARKTQNLPCASPCTTRTKRNFSTRCAAAFTTTTLSNLTTEPSSPRTISWLLSFAMVTIVSLKAWKFSRATKAFLMKRSSSRRDSWTLVVTRSLKWRTWGTSWTKTFRRIKCLQTSCTVSRWLRGTLASIRTSLRVVELTSFSASNNATMVKLTRTSGSSRQSANIWSHS